ncbi:MAG TPA: toluene monooxygenase [Paenibacillaceae bacterium]|nr:toluene monooxygenase [Paenibacillaceae bacterium]
MKITQQVCHEDDVWEGEKYYTVIDGISLVLVRVNDEVKAFQGWCPHQDISFEDAELDGCTLTCLAHVWKYDISTGQGINPKTSKLIEFPIEINEDGNVIVTIEGDMHPSINLRGGIA